MCHSDLTPATEVNCANNFVSKGVVAVDDSFDAGFTAQYPILSRAGIPIFGVEVADALDDHAPNAYFFGPPNEAFSVGPLQVFKSEGYTKLHLSIANVPSAVVYVNNDVNPVAKKLGIEVKTTYFDEATVNWSVVANAMLSDNPQMVGEISTTEQDCDALLPAVRNTGFKGPILMAGCSQYVATVPLAGGQHLQLRRLVDPVPGRDRPGRHPAADHGLQLCHEGERQPRHHGLRPARRHGLRGPAGPAVRPVAADVG